jgi:hypothetical protein
MLTPDGVRYFTAVDRRVARPFHFRWLLPLVLRRNEMAWLWCSRGSIVAIGLLTAWYARSPWMVCVAFLPGVAFAWRHPVLVDAPGMMLALLAAVLWPVCWPAAIVVVLLAGCVRETSPVWAAVYAWNPVMLIGLVPVVIRVFQRAGSDVLDAENAWILRHPFRASRKYHAGLWLDPMVMVAPWGALIVGLRSLDVQLGVALLLGYGQLGLATDSVRLYQWAAPVLAVATVQSVPGWALPFVALGVVFNPWKGSGL